jgi:transposase
VKHRGSRAPAYLVLRNAAILDLHKAGHSYKEIARCVGWVSARAVDHVLQAARKRGDIDLQGATQT